MSLTLTTSNGGLNSIAVAGATAAAPAANTVVCSCTPDAAAGEPTLYKASILSYQQGTPDANLANMFLVVNGVAIGQLLSTNIAGGNAQVARITVPSGATVSVVTGNSVGGAGAIYVASLILTRIQKGGYPVV